MAIGRVSLGTQGSAEVVEVWSDRKEAKELARLLHAGEEVAFVGSCEILESGKLALGTWLLVVTSQRLLCLRGQGPVARRLIDIPLNSVTGVSQRHHSFLPCEVIVTTGQGPLRIGGLARPSADELAAAVIALAGAIARPRAMPQLHTPGQAGDAAGSADARIAHLERLVESMESELVALRQQVDFLEALMRGRSDAGGGSPG